MINVKYASSVKDKIILAFYINVGNSSRIRAKETIQSFMNTFKPTEPNMIHYWFPITEGDTRVECVYPRFTADAQEFKSVIERLDKMSDRISELEK